MSPGKTLFKIRSCALFRRKGINISDPESPGPHEETNPQDAAHISCFTPVSDFGEATGISFQPEEFADPSMLQSVLSNFKDGLASFWSTKHENCYVLQIGNEALHLLYYRYPT
jgi:hypothetical protein